jgi:hypothetical protein
VSRAAGARVFDSATLDRANWSRHWGSAARAAAAAVGAPQDPSSAELEADASSLGAEAALSARVRARINTDQLAGAGTQQDASGSAASANSGRLFTGRKVRSFPDDLLNT